MPDSTHGSSQASEGALEERLRSALSGAAPQGYPTIGVREKVVGSVRAHVRRRKQMAGALAACCLLIAGASAGVAAFHASKNPVIKTAAALLPAHQKAPHSSAQGNSGYLALRSNCGQVSEGFRVAPGCYGVYDRSPDLSFNESDRTAAGKSSGGTAPPSYESATVTPRVEPRDGSYRVLVPVGQTVTVILPGAAGEIWSAPAVAPDKDPPRRRSGSSKEIPLGSEKDRLRRSSRASR